MEGQQKISLVEARMNKGFSEYKVSKIIGISKATLNGYERESGKTPCDVAVRLARLYGLPISNIDF